MQGTLLRRHPPIQSLSQGWTRADQRRSCCACALARQAPELAARMLRQSSLSRSLHVCLLALVHAHGPAAMKTLQPLSIALEARPSNCFACASDPGTLSPILAVSVCKAQGTRRTDQH